MKFPVCLVGATMWKAFSCTAWRTILKDYRNIQLRMWGWERWSVHDNVLLFLSGSHLTGTRWLTFMNLDFQSTNDNFQFLLKLWESCNTINGLCRLAPPFGSYETYFITFSIIIWRTQSWQTLYCCPLTMSHTETRIVQPLLIDGRLNNTVVEIEPFSVTWDITIMNRMFLIHKNGSINGGGTNLGFSNLNKVFIWRICVTASDISGSTEHIQPPNR